MKRILAWGAGACAALTAAAVFAGARDVQIRSVDLDAGVIELFNFGVSSEALDGWRFCTADENEFALYSGFAGMNGLTIEAGTSLFVHFNNDAPGGDPDRVNRSTVGGLWATPLDNGPYGLSVYFPPVIFTDGATMADHLQWSVDGVHNATAAFRSGAAVAGGLWVDATQWIATSGQSIRIELSDSTGGVLHDPNDYAVIEPDPNSPCGLGCEVPGGDADVNDDCLVNLTDLAILLSNFGTAGASHNQGDTNLDGFVNLTDLANLLSRFGAVCPR